MITCERALEAMSERMDVPQAEVDGAMLEEHLASCESCRAREPELRELRSFLRRVEDAPGQPPEVMALRVMAAVTGIGAAVETDQPAVLPGTTVYPVPSHSRRSMAIPAAIGALGGLLLAIPLAVVVIRHSARAAPPPVHAVAAKPAPGAA
ncbi:MAG: hypothetical protein FD180_3009, partial [Planctomycetota bacterium]